MRERLRYAQTQSHENRFARIRSFDAAPAGLSSPVDGRPRVLVCDRYVPAPDRDAGGARMAWILRLLVPLCSHVTFVPVRPFAFAEYAEPLRRVGVEVVVGDGRPLGRLLEARAGMYDVVMLSRAEVAHRCMASVRRHNPLARVIFDTVELTSTRLRQQSSLRGGGDGAAARELRLEDRAIRLSDAVTTVSDAERDEILNRRLGVSASVLPLVYESRVASPGFDSRCGLLFVGNFTHPPNADAVSWFCRAVLPRIHEDAELPLRIVGPGATATTVSGWGTQVTYEGWVPDLTELADGSRVAVAPLRYGAGVKGKVGAALALGLPCVATSIAAEGLDLIDGTHLLIADDAAAFAAAVLRCHADQKTWSELAHAGVEVAADRWSPSAMSQRLAALLRDSGIPRRVVPRPAMLSRSLPTLHDSIN